MKRPTKSAILRFAIPVAAIGAVTVAFRPFHSTVSPVTVALVLLLAILLTAAFAGRNPALLASMAAMLAFNYFFLPPVGTWHIADSANLVAWGTFTLTAVIAGELSAAARRRAEEAERGRREIERLYSELRSAFEKASQAEALRQSEQLKSSLLDAVTHDLRTPLTSIKASVTTLLDDRREQILDDEGRTEFLEIINEETDRLNEFIESMVGLAKVEARALGLKARRCGAEEIIVNAVNRARQRLGRHRVEVAVDPGMPPLSADAASLSEVLYILLDNAAKYSPDGSRILVSAEPAGGRAVISVEDEGRGIPADQRERVFDKFYRGNSGNIHSTGGGLGLGLAIARGIVESQDGRIRIEDGRDGFRTRIVVTVPADSTEAAVK